MAPALRFTARAAVCASLVLAACGCGGGGTPSQVVGGTVAVLNQTDQGQAPLIVEQFFLAPVGDPDPGPNRLAASVLPGGIAILGVFPPGSYNAVAVLDTGQNVTFVDTPVVAGQPTNFVVPGS